MNQPPEVPPGGADTDESLRAAGIIPIDVRLILIRNPMAFDVVRSMSILTDDELRMVDGYIKELVALADPGNC